MHRIRLQQVTTRRGPNASGLPLPHGRSLRQCDLMPRGWFQGSAVAQAHRRRPRAPAGQRPGKGGRDAGAAGGSAHESKVLSARRGAPRPLRRRPCHRHLRSLRRRALVPRPRRAGVPGAGAYSILCPRRANLQQWLSRGRRSRQRSARSKCPVPSLPPATAMCWRACWTLRYPCGVLRSPML